MPKIATLAEGQVTSSPHEMIIVELVQPDDMPAVVKITWPPYPTVAHPRKFPATASAAMRILANAVTRLAGIRMSAP